MQKAEIGYYRTVDKVGVLVPLIDGQLASCGVAHPGDSFYSWLLDLLSTGSASLVLLFGAGDTAPAPITAALTQRLGPDAISPELWLRLRKRLQASAPEYLVEMLDASTGLDTAPRDVLLESVAQELLGESWPGNCDPDTQFRARIVAALATFQKGGGQLRP